MPPRLTRLAVLNGVLTILFGMLIPGAAATLLVMRGVYHQPAPIDPGQDYRAWMMAHLEGLLNGMLVIALALGAALLPMAERRGKVLFWSLVAMAWGNSIAATLSPIFGVRAMALNDDPANNLILGVYVIAFVGTIIAFYIVIRHLWFSKESA